MSEAQTEQTEAQTETAAVPEKAPKVEQNGIVRPKAGTATARVWEIADEKSAASGAPVKRKDVLAAAAEEGLNAATVATQYGRWRVFYGLGKEEKAAADPAAVKPKKEKKAKAAEAAGTDTTVEGGNEPADAGVAEAAA